MRRFALVSSGQQHDRAVPLLPGPERTASGANASLPDCSKSSAASSPAPVRSPSGSDRDGSSPVGRPLRLHRSHRPPTGPPAGVPPGREPRLPRVERQASRARADVRLVPHVRHRAGRAVLRRTPVVGSLATCRMRLTARGGGPVRGSCRLRMADCGIRQLPADAPMTRRMALPSVTPRPDSSAARQVLERYGSLGRGRGEPVL